VLVLDSQWQSQAVTVFGSNWESGRDIQAVTVSGSNWELGIDSARQ
jgi:hypothetical protein